jgi:hypothetical protein
MSNKWKEKYLASVIMNIIGTALVLASLLSAWLGNQNLALFLGFSGIICCNVACVNL